MNPAAPPPFSLSETWWRGIILALSLTVLLFSVWCLTQGITTIFMHLYYFPIVLLAYHYRWKGCGLATLLALAYLGLVIVFNPGQSDVILGAFYRFLIFVGIAAVIAYLSDRLAQARSTMQQSAELRDRYLSLAPAIVLALDRNGAITYLSKHGGEILDCIPDDAIGKLWIEQFLPEKDRERVKKIFSQLMAGQVEQNRIVENLVMTCGGVEKIIRWHNTVLNDEKGAISGILGFGEDITEEKWRQDTLNKMQQFQESVITNANVWISVLEPDGTLLVWNDAAEAISGYKKTGVLGKRTVWKQLYPDNEYRKKVTGDIQRIISRDTFLENFETEIRCADGTKKIIVWNTRGQRDTKGAITSYIAIGRDITQQTKAEAEIRHLATFPRLTPVNILESDLSGKILYSNPAMENTITAIGISDPGIFIPPDFLKKSGTEPPRTTPFQSETELVIQNRTFTLNLSFVPESRSVRVYATDITQRKQTEDALKKSETLLNDVSEMAHVGGWELDVRTKAVRWTKETYRIHDISEDEKFDLSHAVRFFDLPDRSTLEAALKRGMDLGEPFDLELPFTSAGGRHLWTRAMGRAVKSEGTVVKLTGTFQDITERRQAKEAIMGSEERYRNLYNSSSDAIMILEPPFWRFTSGNPASVQMFMAKDEAEFTSKDALELSPERQPDGRDSGDKTKEMIETALRNGTHFFEWTHRRFNGEDFPATVLLSKGILDRKVFLQATVRDITEHKREERALILSEQTFHSYVDNSPVGIFVADGAGHYLDVNYASCNLLGYSRKEMLSMNVLDLAPLEERQQTLDQFIDIKERLKTESSVSLEMRLKKKDGSACPVILSVVKLPSDAIMGFALDITERKRIEESLQKSEERFRTMMNWTYDWEYWIAPDRDVVYCSPSIEHITGYSAEEFIADKGLIDRIIHPDDHPLWERHIPIHTVHQEEKKPFEIDFRIIAKNGSPRWIHHTCRAIFAGDGRWIGMRISNRDITEQKQAEQVLWESEERYRSLTESLTENIFIIDRDDTIRFVNTHAAETLHLPADEIIGKPRKKFFPPEFADHQGMILKKVFDTGEPSRNEERVVSGNQESWQDNVLIPLKDETGNVTSVIGVSRDISERKRVELELASAYENLKEAYRLAHIGTWNWVMEKDTVTWSEELYNIAGRDLLLPAPTYAEMPRIYTPASWNLLNAAVTNALTTGEPYNLELELIRSDGSIRWINAFGGVQRDETGKVIGLHGTLQDITERKKAEEEIHISNVILKTQQETSPDGILIVDKFGKILSFNRRFVEIWKIPQEVIDSRSDERALSFVMDKLADPEEFLSRVRYLYEHPQEKSQEEILLKDKKMLDRYSAPMLGKDNQYFGRVWYFHDITERKRAEEAIRSREEQFRVIFHNQQTGLVMVDAVTHTITDANGAALSMIGASREDVIGKVCHTFICPAEKGKCPVSDLGQTVDNSERVLIRKNGEKIPILKSVNPIKISGRPFLIESFVDLTERKQMEKQIVESRQLFADIISFLPDPTFVIDKDGNVLAWNRALEQLSGVPAGDMIGKGEHEYSLWQYGKRRPILIDLVLHPDQDASRMNYTGIHWEGRTVTAQTQIVQPGSGHTISLSLVASPLIDVQGKITGAIESIRDISRLKEAEAELGRINQNLEQIVSERTRLLQDEVAQRMRAEKDVQDALSYTRSVIEANPDLMVVLDRNGTVLDINAAAESLTGIPQEQLIGTLYSGYLVDDGTLYDAFSRLLKEGRIENFVKIRHTDGHITPLSVNATIIGKKDAPDVRIIVSAHDITRQKKDEEVIRASLDEKVILLREVHHRVKNNLQIIISLVNLQMRQTDDPEVKQIMSETQNRVRAMSLVHEKLYRSESLSRIDFADYTRYLATQLLSFYGADTQRVRLDFVMGKIMVDINTAVPLGLLMNELISNALKHAFPNGREGTISISGSDENNLITLVVHDDGIGIAADFDWKNTTSLGMRLVTSLIDQVDGTVTLDRSAGTTFTIVLKKKD